MQCDASPIVIEQIFRASITSVWSAITTPDQMRQWLFESISDFKPEVGFETQFDVRADGKNYIHIWKVTEAIPQRRLVYEWRYGGYVGNSYVKWELSEIDRETKLTFTHVGHETIRGDDIFSRKNGIAGWTYLIRESLHSSLARWGD